MIRERLADVYNHVDDIDVWVGGLAEDRLPNAMVGELIFTVLKEQFEALRDGDRFWYRLIFDQETIDTLENTRLADIIRRNTGIGREIPDNVFRVRFKNLSFRGVTRGTAILLPLRRGGIKSQQIRERH